MSETMFYIPVAGTHGRTRKRPWFREGSMFDEYLTDYNWSRLATEFGFWDTALAGLRIQGSRHLAWSFGGLMLYQFLRDHVPYKDRIIIAHSHGGQVAFYAMAHRPHVPIRALITVDTPVRGDMAEQRKAASEACPLHVHLYGKGWGSRMRWLGQQGAFTRKMPEPHVLNLPMRGGHSGILRKSKYVSQILDPLDLIRNVGRES